MNNATVIDTFSLYFTKGSSDKEYHADLVQHPNGYQVLARNGRRGGTLTHREKTQVLAEESAAREVFESVLKEKLRDGYTLDVSGAAYAGHEKAGLESGETLPLLTKTEMANIHNFTYGNDWFMQQKIDGERRAVIFDGEAAQGINKHNLLTPLPLETSEALIQLIHSQHPGPFMVDAEIVGAELHVFDITRLGGNKLTNLKSPIERVDILEKLLSNNTSPLLHFVRTARTSDEKAQLLRDIEDNNLEGVAIKYKSRDGEALKFKFYEECSVVVLNQNGGKRSVEIGIKNAAGEVYGVGNVTVPVNQNIPEVGNIVEVSYLYAYEGGSLFQPTLRRIRTDITEPDTDDKLKYKPKTQSMRP